MADNPRDTRDPRDQLDQRDDSQDRDSLDRDRDQERKPFFATPFGLLLTAVVLALLSGAAAAGANLALEEMSFRRSAAQIIITYVLYAPATLLALLAVATAIIGSVRWAIYGRDSVGVPLEQTEAAQRELLESINQRMLVSETAKRIAFRHEDLDLLRRTIEGDIRQGDFDAALVLVAELANTYGYREESERYRDRVDQARQRERDAKVSEAVARLEDILNRHDFEEALREANKLQRLYTDSAKVRELPRRVMASREQYKRDLERQFLEASQREDVERAMALLKEMDKYLSEQEAAPAAGDGAGRHRQGAEQPGRAVSHGGPRPGLDRGRGSGRADHPRVSQLQDGGRGSRHVGCAPRTGRLPAPRLGDRQRARA